MHESGNNQRMSKALDYISLTVILLFTTFAWSTLFLPGWIYPLIFSCAFSAIVVYSVRRVLSRKSKPYNYDRLSLELAVKGNQYLINLIKSALNKADFESGCNYILIGDSILVAAYKFAPLNISDLSNVLQLAEKHTKRNIFVMARGVDRRAYQALQLESVNLNIIKIKQIYRYLEKHDALPDLKTRKRKFSFSAFFEIIFQRSNTKNYIFSGTVLIAIAFLTPLKIYYLVLGSLSLFMALLTLTPIGKGSFRSSKAFDLLEEQCKAQESGSDRSTEDTAQSEESESAVNSENTATDGKVVLIEKEEDKYINKNKDID